MAFVIDNCPRCDCSNGGGNKVLLVTGGNSRKTQAQHLGNSSINCPQLPDIPRGFSYGAGFLRDGRVPVVCGGSSTEQACLKLVKNWGIWTWEAADRLVFPQSAPGYAQVGRDLWIAGRNS